MNCRELITFLETEVPLETAEGWDNPGFLVGDKDKEIKKGRFYPCTSSDHFFKDQQMHE